MSKTVNLNCKVVEGMSRKILSPLHTLAVAALAVPMLGLGYIAGNGDVLAVYRLNLELSLSGAGDDYDGKRPDASQPILPIIAEANDLFDARGKGPRADLLYRQRVDRSVDYAARRRQAELALMKGERALAPDAPVTTIYPSKQVVNRSVKGDRQPIQVAVADFSQTSVIEGQTSGDDEGRRKIAAGLPLINQESVAGVFDVKHNVTMASQGPHFPEARGQMLPDPNRKPVFTGLDVKHVASLQGGKRKFFGGLTEDEFRRRENRCLATAIYFEARSEPIKGQIAVAQVIMNRVRSGFYADTVCGVVYEGAHKRNACQFSFACDGLADKPKDKKRWKIAMDLAKQVTDGKVWLRDIGHASHYHATYVSPRWRRSMTRIKRIGAHIFYRAKFFTRNTKVATIR